MDPHSALSPASHAHAVAPARPGSYAFTLLHAPPAPRPLTPEPAGAQAQFLLLFPLPSSLSPPSDSTAAFLPRVLQFLTGRSPDSVDGPLPWTASPEATHRPQLPLDLQEPLSFPNTPAQFPPSVPEMPLPPRLPGERLAVFPGPGPSLASSPGGTHPTTSCRVPCPAARSPPQLFRPHSNLLVLLTRLSSSINPSRLDVTDLCSQTPTPPAPRLQCPALCPRNKRPLLLLPPFSNKALIIMTKRVLRLSSSFNKYPQRGSCSPGVCFVQRRPARLPSSSQGVDTPQARTLPGGESPPPRLEGAASCWF